MKKIIRLFFVVFICVLAWTKVHAAPSCATGNYYACKNGYYFSSSSCTACNTGFTLTASNSHTYGAAYCIKTITDHPCKNPVVPHAGTYDATSNKRRITYSQLTTPGDTQKAYCNVATCAAGYHLNSVNNGNNVSAIGSHSTTNFVANSYAGDAVSSTGKCDTCKAGYYYSGNDSNWTCTACPAGYVASSSDGHQNAGISSCYKDIDIKCKSNYNGHEEVTTPGGNSSNRPNYATEVDLESNKRISVRFYVSSYSGTNVTHTETYEENAYNCTVTECATGGVNIQGQNGHYISADRTGYKTSTERNSSMHPSPCVSCPEFSNGAKVGDFEIYDDIVTSGGGVGPDTCKSKVRIKCTCRVGGGGTCDDQSNPYPASLETSQLIIDGRGIIVGDNEPISHACTVGSCNSGYYFVESKAGNGGTAGQANSSTDKTHEACVACPSDNSPYSGKNSAAQTFAQSYALDNVNFENPGNVSDEHKVGFDELARTHESGPHKRNRAAECWATRNVPCSCVYGETEGKTPYSVTANNVPGDGVIANENNWGVCDTASNNTLETVPSGTPVVHQRCNFSSCAARDFLGMSQDASCGEGHRFSFSCTPRTADRCVSTPETCGVYHRDAAWENTISESNPPNPLYCKDIQTCPGSYIPTTCNGAETPDASKAQCVYVSNAGEIEYFDGKSAGKFRSDHRCDPNSSSEPLYFYIMSQVPAFKP